MITFVDMVWNKSGWFLLALALGYALKWRREVGGALLECSPYLVLALVFLLVHSAAGLINPDVGGTELVNMVEYNGFQVVRCYLFASVGLIACAHLGWKEVSLLWSDPVSALRRIPLRIVLAVSAVIAIYTFALTHLFAQNILNRDLPFSFVLSDYTLGAMGAVVEELAIRCFLLSVLMYLVRTKSMGWFFALSISSVYWTVMHLSDGGLWRIGQILPLGFLFGVVFRRYGLETTVSIHLVSNFFIMIPNTLHIKL